jgi:hypothetical protein
MRRAFLWLSGTDPDILSDCILLSKTERTRLAALGALTLVPAVLGTLSMSYAISMIADNSSSIWALGSPGESSF